MLRFSGVGVTDVGGVREENEDAAFMGPYLALVADGVGGGAAGEVASATAAAVLVEHAAGHRTDDPSVLLHEAVAVARERLVAGVVEDERRAGMATTVTAIATDGRRVVLAQLGDSRAYLFRDGLLHQVSVDHTWVQKLVEEGHLAPDDVRHHPWRHVVLRSLHAGPVEHAPLVDVVDLEVRPGDRMLLCTDGLTDEVPPARINEVLHLADPRSAAARLVEDALEAGGLDNVTCLVLDVVEGPEVSGDGQALGSLREPLNVVGAAPSPTLTPDERS